MTIRRPITLGVVAALLIVGVGGATAAAPRQSGPLATVQRHTTPDGTVTTSGLDPVGLALTAFDPRNPRTLLDASRALTSQEGAGQSADTMAVENSTASSPSYEETYRSVDVVGDLDGDGISDTVLTTYTSTDDEQSVTVEGRRGVDGRLLWTLEDVDGAYAQDAGDLDGDGHDDLLIVGLHDLESDVRSECDETGCRDSGTYRFVWTYGVRDGATGRSLWADSALGSYSYEYTVDFRDGSGTERVTGVNELLGVSLLSTPGGPRVVANLVDLEVDRRSTTTDPTGTGLGSQTGLLSETRDRSTVRSSTRAAVREARTGATLLTRETQDLHGVPFLMPAGQLVGDQAEDLLWTVDERTDGDRTCTQILTQRECQGEEARSALVVEAIDGATLQTGWSARTDDGTDGFTFPLGADLDADGVGDVMVLTIAIQDDALELATMMLSGASGEERWRLTEDDWLFPVSMDDVDGDGDTDLQTVLYTVDPESFASTIRLVRLDGRSGEVLFETQAPERGAGGDGAGCAFTFTYVGGMGDVDDDGVSDLFGGDVVEAYESCAFDEPSVSHVLWGESGATGEGLYVQQGDGLRVGFPAGDLDGDGRPDLLVEARDTGSTSTTASRLEAVALPGLSPLWTLGLPLADYSYAYAIDDVDGDDLRDLLVVSGTSEGDEEDGYRYESSVRLHRGTDGAALWAAPNLPTMFSRASD